MSSKVTTTLNLKKPKPSGGPINLRPKPTNRTAFQNNATKNAKLATRIGPKKTPAIVSNFWKSVYDENAFQQLFQQEILYLSNNLYPDDISLLDKIRAMDPSEFSAVVE